jgi:hypothetical protein
LFKTCKTSFELNILFSKEPFSSLINFGYSERKSSLSGIKAKDYRICYCCHKHHVMMDSSNELSREERINLWEDAHRRTIGWLFENGHLEVK